MGDSREYRLGAIMPPWTSSMPASESCSCTFSTRRAWAGMSASSQMRPSMYGACSAEWWNSTSSVHTTDQPPSALVPRMAAWPLGCSQPMPLQCGTWKKRLRAVTGPILTGSNRMSNRGSRMKHAD